MSDSEQSTSSSDRESSPEVLPQRPAVTKRPSRVKKRPAKLRDSVDDDPESELTLPDELRYDLSSKYCQCQAGSGLL